jgi:hypothetical protein
MMMGGVHGVLSLPLVVARVTHGQPALQVRPCGSLDSTDSQADSQMTSVLPAETSGSDMEGQVPRSL